MFGSVVGQRGRRTAVAVLVSVVFDVLMVALFVFLTRFGYQAYQEAQLPEDPNANIVWLSQEGPGGGGGGGGNKMPDPPKVAELPGKEKITVPAAPPPVLEPKNEPKVEPPVVEPINIPAVTLAASTDSLPGAIDAPTVPTLSQGSGTQGGAGTGAGKGVGPGTGSGLGPGFGGGTGGGAYRPGNGVTSPRILYQEKLTYTGEAMRARIQGTVLVACIVQANGSVTDARIVRSLDPVFGLDQEALRAVRLWQFAPGKRFGEAVPVEITVELTFALR
jgi:protein TonB